MILPGFKSEIKQQLLFDEPLGGHAHARNILGEFVEELTAKILGGKRHKTDSRCEYCPDVSRGSFYFECKSVGRSREILIYKGRLEKDFEFAESNALYYVVWHHTCQTKHAKTVDDLKSLFLTHMKCVYIVPFLEIFDICADIDPIVLNSKYGGSDHRIAYKQGYRVNIKKLSKWKSLEWETH